MLEQKTRYQEGKKVSYISLIANILLAILKISIGLLAASTALIADGFHSVSDMASTLIVLISMKLSEAPADKNHPYGHEKAEALGTNLLAVILIITAVFLSRDAFLTLISGEISQPGFLALVVAFISIAAKELLYRYTIIVGKRINSRALIADAHHHRSDALSSIAALIGIAGARMGFTVLDPLAGLVVAVLIFKVGYDILKATSYELMDGRPSKEKIATIHKTAETIEGVIDVSDIKIRSYGPRYIVDLKIVVSGQLTVRQGHNIAAAVKQKIVSEHDDVKDVLVHVNPNSVH